VTLGLKATGLLPADWYTYDDQLRVTFREENREENAYIVVFTEGHKTTLFEDGEVGYDPSMPDTTAGNVTSIHFHVPSDQFGESDFSFCISNLKAVVE
jgi:hypothetical protein